MERDARSYLWDMREAADAIAEFTVSMNATKYAESRVVRAAVERQFEIIGEALNQLAKLDQRWRTACQISAISSHFVIC